MMLCGVTQQHSAGVCSLAGPPVQLSSERQSPPDERPLGAPQNVAPPDQSLLLLLRQVEAALQGSRGLSVLHCGGPVRLLRLTEAAVHRSRWYSKCLSLGQKGP